MLTVFCSKCGNKYELDDTMAGKLFVCRKCGADFRLPRNQNEAASAPKEAIRIPSVHIFPSTKRLVLLLCLALVLLAASGVTWYALNRSLFITRIDGTTEASFRESVASARASLPEESRRDFDEAIMVVGMQDVDEQTNQVPGLAEAKMRQALHGMAPQEIREEATVIKMRQNAERERVERERREMEKRRAEEERLRLEREKAKAEALAEKSRKEAESARLELEAKNAQEPPKPEKTKEEIEIENAIAVLEKPYRSDDRFKRRDSVTLLAKYQGQWATILPVLAKVATGDPDMWTRRRAFHGLRDMAKASEDKNAMLVATAALLVASEKDDDAGNRKEAKTHLEQLLGTAASTTPETAIVNKGAQKQEQEVKPKAKAIVPDLFGMKEFTKIIVGNVRNAMTVSEINKLLGKNGEVVSQSDNTRMMKWINPSGSYIIVHFRSVVDKPTNGGVAYILRASQKSQNGLK